MDFETNASKLPWMQDRHGFVANLRREGCRSIGRMMGDDQKMEVLMDTLRILARYAAAKMEEQKVTATKAKIRRIETTREATVRNMQDANAIERQLQSERDSVDKRLVALRTRKAQAEAEQAVIQSSRDAEALREAQQTTDGIGTERSS